MSLLRQYVRAILAETRDPDFLAAIEGLWGEWEGVQSSIPTENVTEEEFMHFYNQETEEMDQDYRPVNKDVQVTKGEKKPSFTEENPEHYDARTSQERRVKYGQTQPEIDVERKLMTLWQEHADIDFFKSDKMTFAHNVVYPSHARMMGLSRVKISNPGRGQWLSAQEKRQKDTISVSAAYTPGGKIDISSQGWMSKGWGFLIDGHPIFASAGDLATQTQRAASDKAKEYYKSSGLPKRAGMTHVKTDKMGDRKARMKRKLYNRRGMSDEEIDEKFEIDANFVILNEEDIQDRDGRDLGEVLLDNWTVKAWYIAELHSSKKFFKEALRSGKLTKPIYLLRDAWKGDNTTKKFDPQDEKDVEDLLDIFDDHDQRRV